MVSNQARLQTKYIPEELECLSKEGQEKCEVKDKKCMSMTQQCVPECNARWQEGLEPPACLTHSLTDCVFFSDCVFRSETSVRLSNLDCREGGPCRFNSRKAVVCHDRRRFYAIILLLLLLIYVLQGWPDSKLILRFLLGYYYLH